MSIRAAPDLWRIERRFFADVPAVAGAGGNRDHPVRSIERSSPPIGRRFDAGELAGVLLGLYRALTVPVSR